MVITIDIDNLKDLSIAQYAFLTVKFNLPEEDAYRVVGISNEQVEDLIVKGYLTEDRKVTNLFISKFNTVSNIFKGDDSNITSFVESYRSIFPSGNNQSGYPYRGDKQGCIKKMKRFLKQYPNFGKDDILTVTKDYVNYHFFKGYTYMQTAAYLIEKDGTSNLAALCEAYKNKSDLYSKVTRNPIKGGMEEDLN